MVIYECLPCGKIKLLQAYLDADTCENFYTCAWSFEVSSGLPYLAAAGAKGVIRIISPTSLTDIKVEMTYGAATFYKYFFIVDCENYYFHDL